MRYPATLRAGIVLNSQEFAARDLTFVIIDVSVRVLTVISELAIFRKRNAESCAFSRPFASRAASRINRFWHSCSADFAAQKQ